MRAAHILATALVVANARPKWRADRALLPALATSPGYPANHTQKHNPEQYTHTLAAQMAVWPAGCFTQQATHARTAHHRAAATSLVTLQRSAANFPHVLRPCAAPAHLHALCCTAAQPCKPKHAPQSLPPSPPLRGLAGFEGDGGPSGNAVTPPLPWGCEGKRR